VFSTGRRASGNLLQIVLDFLQKVPGGQSRILKQTQEELFLGPPGAGKKGTARAGAAQIAAEGQNVSKCYSYPSSVTGNTSSHHHFLFFFFFKRRDETYMEQER